MRRRVRLSTSLRQKIGGKEYESLVRPLVLEHPQALLGTANSLFLAALRAAELGELQIAPLRGRILGAQRDAGVDLAVAFGEEVENVA